MQRGVLSNFVCWVKPSFKYLFGGIYSPVILSVTIVFSLYNCNKLISYLEYIILFSNDICTKVDLVYLLVNTMCIVLANTRGTRHKYLIRQKANNGMLFCTYAIYNGKYHVYLLIDYLRGFVLRLLKIINSFAICKKCWKINFKTTINLLHVTCILFHKTLGRAFKLSSRNLLCRILLALRS